LAGREPSKVLNGGLVDLRQHRVDHGLSGVDIIVTFAEASNPLFLRTAVAAGQMVWTPSGDVTNLAGNACSTAAASET
jgi:hypothetical protein